MDFFSAAGDPATQAVSLAEDTDTNDVDTFAQAIANRFGSNALLTARLIPSAATPVRPPVMTLSPSSPFSGITATDVLLWLGDPSALIVDIRPHAAHTSARIPRAISLSVPSTLLKRPLFSLERLSAMLPSASARKSFSAWASATRILVYDADSQTIGDSSNLTGLLRKFQSDGFKGQLAWLRGGFQAVWRECRDIVDTQPPTPDADNDDDDNDEPDKPAQPSVLRTRHLPMAAFSLSSTTVHNSPPFNAAAASSVPKRLPPSTLARVSSSTTPANSHPAFNPFFDTIRQNTELSHGITERIPLRLPRRVRRRIQDLPFHWLQDIAHRAAKAPYTHRSLSDSTSSESEDTDDGATTADVEEGMEALAMQFFKIELAEQRRLMGIMEHHSKESGQPGEHAPLLVPFPFSITAGVEKGAKNRYRHIWPFEHARVRLHQNKEVDDDYVNASYVQPLGTNKRYIATQGPLPATFTDFWTLCWEQNVHVIVMLTREVEGAMVKCGSYWSDTEFGPLRLRLVSTEGLAPPEERPSTAHPTSFFVPQSTSSKQTRKVPHSAGSERRYRHHHYRTNRSETVKRTFELVHTGYPEAKPRQIVHLQYLEWPDMNVPEDPRGVLGLIKQVEDAVRETQADKPRRRTTGPISVTEVDEKTGIATHAIGADSPVLLHCSAGVGRTGGFIAVDAILDAIRRDVRSRLQASSKRDGDAMDVDSPDRSQSVQTMPITISSGAAHGSDGRSESAGHKHHGLVVHVPLAPMQVDTPNEEQADVSEGEADVPRTTMQWAENVRAETHSSSNTHRPQLDRRDTISPPVSAAVNYSRTSSSGGFTASSDAASRRGQLYGTYPHSSSSLGTSVSGTSSSSKANFPSSSNSRDASSQSDLLQTVLNQQASAERHRLRTFSAPTADVGVRQVHHNLSLPLAQTQAGISFPVRPSLRGEAEDRMVEDTEPPVSRVNVVKHSGSDGGNSSSQPHSNAAGLLSEGEIPSRSQSPSADEGGSAAAAPQPRRAFLPSAPMQASPTSMPRLGLSSAPIDEAPSKTFDYKDPRPLHEVYTPPAISAFDDPIWEVVQDMREQRMSLCQSLRQYVFVHAAIIEGTLMVLDEEREAALGLGHRNGSPPVPSNSASSSTMTGHSKRDERKDGGGKERKSRSRTTSVTSTSSKRGASPTELLKEDKEGELMLSKRPSIKRKQRSGDDGLRMAEKARYHPVPNRVSSSVMHAGGVSAPSSTSMRAMPP